MKEKTCLEKKSNRVVIWLVSVEQDGYKIELTPTYLKQLYRRLIIMGFSKIEAGNLIAIMHGLEACSTGWTIKEISHILFVQKLEREENKNDHA